jgi:hypothetical protein
MRVRLYQILRADQDNSVPAKVLLFFALGLLLQIGCDVKATNSDSFLDQPLPPGFLPHIESKALLSMEGTMAFGQKIDFGSTYLQYNSYQERLRDLKAFIPKPIIFPQGFTEFIGDEESKPQPKGLDNIFPIAGCGMPANSLRSYLDFSMQLLGLRWTYDPVKNAIITDIDWRRSDPRTSRELVHVLARSRLIAYDDLLKKQNWGQKNGLQLDPWRIAFDALLSKPENLSTCWKLRFCEEARKAGFSATMPVDNLLAATVPDEMGKPHFLVLDFNPMVAMPGPGGSICYYLFDPNGKFEKGGIFETDYRCGNTIARLNANRTELTISTYFNSFTPVDTSYTLTQDGLTSKKPVTFWSAELRFGKVMYATSE